MRHIAKVSIAAVALGLLAGTAPAHAQMNLRVSDYVPATHYLAVQGMKPFMDEVTKETSGALKFEYFPAQQLGKASDMLRLAESNTTQVSMTGVSFPGDRMELSDVAQLPGVSSSACDGLAAYNKLINEPNSVLNATDYTRNNVHYLWGNMLPPFQIYMHAKEITKPDQLKGLKILSPQHSGFLALNHLGAVPIQLTSGPQAYDSLLRGVADGTIFAADSVVAYDMIKLTKFVIRNSNFGGQLPVAIMNLQTWNGLDQKTKDIVTKVADETGQRVCHYVDAAVQPAIDKLVAAGDKLTYFDAAGLDQMRQINAQVQIDWAQSLDSRGKPGTQILKEYLAALPKS
jgi:TRAP-type C4-dicarboxylate transport system substrate-binding protein